MQDKTGPDESDNVVTGPDESDNVVTGPDESDNVVTGPDESDNIVTGPDESDNVYMIRICGCDYDKAGPDICDNVLTGTDDFDYNEVPRKQRSERLTLDNGGSEEVTSSHSVIIESLF
ncbi:hypothetical protein BgiBS90_021104 [Biomphalaria glabrata]|nr:hypothetical protein BgiBS90_021104 [Biomphalaria glabrata]